jgi:hypothetical protein
MYTVIYHPHSCFFLVVFLPTHPRSLPFSRIPSHSSSLSTNHPHSFPLFQFHFSILHPFALIPPAHPQSYPLIRSPFHSSALLPLIRSAFHSSALLSTHPHSFPLLFIPSREHVPNSSLLLIQTFAPLPRSLALLFHLLYMIPHFFSYIIVITLPPLHPHPPSLKLHLHCFPPLFLAMCLSK